MTVDMGSGLGLSVETCLNVIEGDFITDEDIAMNGRIAEIDIADGVGGHLRTFGNGRAIDEILAEARQEAENFSCLGTTVRHFQKQIQHTIYGTAFTLYYICIDYQP